MERDGRVSIAVTAPYDSWSEIQGLSMSARANSVLDFSLGFGHTATVIVASGDTRIEVRSLH
jgi:hypothetical protein